MYVSRGWRYCQILVIYTHAHNSSSSPHRSISSPCSLAHGGTIILRGEGSASRCLLGWKGRWDTHRHRSASYRQAGLKGRWIYCVIMAARLQLVGGGHVDIERTLTGSGVQRRTLNLVCYDEALVLSVDPWPCTLQMSAKIKLSASHPKLDYFQFSVFYTCDLGYCESLSWKAIDGEKMFFCPSRKQVRQRVSCIVLSNHFHVLIGSKSTWDISWEESHKAPKVAKWYWFCKVTKVKSENLFVFLCSYLGHSARSMARMAYSPCQQCLKLQTFSWWESLFFLLFFKKKNSSVTKSLLETS